MMRSVSIRSIAIDWINNNSKFRSFADCALIKFFTKLPSNLPLGNAFMLHYPLLILTLAFNFTYATIPKLSQLIFYNPASVIINSPKLTHI